MEVILPLVRSVPPLLVPPLLVPCPPPEEIFFRCAGYLAAYNSLIYGIFLLIIYYKLSLS